ncbi:MAG: 50S ribosomal protein L29 [Akkermansia sp.]
MSDKNSPKDLRAMSAKELSALVRSLREELFNLRLQQYRPVGKQPENRTVRKDLPPLPFRVKPGDLIEDFGNYRIF